MGILGPLDTGIRETPKWNPKITPKTDPYNLTNGPDPRLMIKAIKNCQDAVDSASHKLGKESGCKYGMYTKIQGLFLDVDRELEKLIEYETSRIPEDLKKK